MNNHRQYRLEYDQRLAGYSGDLPEHWRRVVEIHDSVGRLKAAQNRLGAYLEQQAENYPGGEWVRNIAVQSRTVTYSDWSECSDDSQHPRIGGGK